MLKQCRQFKFYGNRTKAQCLPKELQVLGYVFTRRGIPTISRSVTSILQWHVQQNRTHLPSFLGMLNYFSRFVPYIDLLATPLTEMTGATANWNWTPTHTTCFKKIKMALSKEPAVRPIDYKNLDPIYIVTGVSLICTEAWIGQGPTSETIVPTGNHSLRFNSAQKNYKTFDK